MSCECNNVLQSNGEINASATTFPEIDCFKMKKVYDWVRMRSDKTAVVLVPPQDLDALKRALELGHTIDVKADIPVNECTAVVALVTREAGTPCACCSIRKNAFLHITITDSTAGVIISQFVRDVQMFDSTKLCFPADMPQDAIKPRVVATLAESLSTAPIDGTIAFNVELCQEISVELEVMVKVKVEGLCNSRGGVPCTNSLACIPGPSFFPTQCKSTDCT